jgi:hypothetical protein
MDALYIALVAPILPVLMFAGAWVFVRREPPARGVPGLSCDGTRAPELPHASAR